VDESNGEEKTEQMLESESAAKGLSPGVLFMTFQHFSEEIQSFNCYRSYFILHIFAACPFLSTMKQLPQ